MGWRVGIYCCSIADIVIAVARRLCAVFVRIKTRAGRAGVYLKAIVTCVNNFGTFIEWLWNGDGGWASIVAVSQTLLLSSLDDCV